MRICLLAACICSARAVALRGAALHLLHSPFLASRTPLDDLVNTRIPLDGTVQLLAHVARPKSAVAQPGQRLPLLLLIHEFFGLSTSIVEKAQLFADELGCVCVAVDTFRGVRTSLIPYAIWLALSTPQQRVDDDLEQWVRWAASQEDIDTRRIAVMGFCYGGGKAIRYAIGRRPTAATVVWYGEPVLETEALRKLRAPVCAVFGADDLQIPQARVDAFRDSLASAAIEHEVVSYFGAGHAFFSDVAQVKEEQMPQIAAWRLTTNFLRGYYRGDESFSSKRDFLEFLLAQEEDGEGVTDTQI
eukprot:CAMPEP_0183339312 /NCGR_PEP_ID=MMETSP0164_2-20130417/6280_1 /TAXON_ID=221442 /ORGANISM="Coccolithus pelagicus ssp braarudi, Strain PLY182g" /LENGTH=301 /DNA_ID=CAMNT_0025509281 /DNA_START=25 /DNA_END=930 /DNA_ORIENTATION=+